MADVFVEHMVTRRPDIKSRFIKIGIAAAVVAAAIAISFVGVMIPAVSFLALPAIAGACWGGFKLMRRQNIEFEYILTNSEIDIDKIFDRSARKRLLSVDCRSFEVLAPYKPAFTGEYQGISVTLDASSGSEDAARYFAVCQGKDSQRMMLIFEPNERMMTTFRSYIPRKIKQ